MAAAAAEVRCAAAAVAADESAALMPGADEEGVAADATDLADEGGVAERLEDLERLEEGRADADSV